MGVSGSLPNLLADQPSMGLEKSIVIEASYDAYVRADGRRWTRARLTGGMGRAEKMAGMIGESSSGISSVGEASSSEGSSSSLPNVGDSSNGASNSSSV